MPALLTGFALAFARAIGEYGSVIFIAGNMPMVSEITPLIIITKLEQYDYAGATAVAVVMLVVVVRAAARDQRVAGLDAPPAGRPRLRMIDDVDCHHPATCLPRTRRRAAANRPACAALLIGTALLFLALFLFVPLAFVFYEALRKGLGVYLAAIAEPDALDAIKLTLLVAAIAVPMNLVFGVAAAWSIAKFSFPGQERADHADRPAVLGVAGDFRPDLRAGLRAPGLARAVALRRTISRSFSPFRESCWRRCSSRFRSSRAN